MIWSHDWEMLPWIFNDRVAVSQYPLSSALWGICWSKIAHLGVIAHEVHFGCKASFFLGALCNLIFALPFFPPWKLAAL